MSISSYNHCDCCVITIKYRVLQKFCEDYRMGEMFRESMKRSTEFLNKSVTRYKMQIP